MWDHRVEEPEGEGAALGVGAGGGHVGVVEAELGAPGLKAGLTGLLHIRGPCSHVHTLRLDQTA